MRTTLVIDDDVLEHARVLAQDKGVSLGSAVSELMRRGLRRSAMLEQTQGGGFPTFRVSENAPAITLETVKKAEEEER
jgi:hypothetical protein